ncbi:MAG: STAS domain-containing protein [Acidobacteria bacterium]|nr:STAS domain-containing protein [Acidobacteriota bacterium]
MTKDKELEIDIIRWGGCSVVHVEGDINWKTSPKLRAAILALFERRGQERVIVDLERAHHIDSSGVSSFIEGLQAATEKRARFILSGLNQQARHMLELTRLSTLFQITQSVEQALRQ